MDQAVTPRRPLYVRTDAALARILNVSRPAVRKAAERERITRRDDGWWCVLDVVKEWRAHTWRPLQRPSGRVRPWLDPRRKLTRDILAELERRARAEGAVEG